MKDIGRRCNSVTPVEPFRGKKDREAEMYAQCLLLFSATEFFLLKFF